MSDEIEADAGVEPRAGSADASPGATPASAQAGAQAGAQGGGLQLAEQLEGLPSRRSNGVLGVPIEVLISVGKARPLVSQLVNLRRDSVLPLDSRIDDPVEIYIGDRLIARGELQELEGSDGQLAVRLTEIEDLSNGV